MRQAHEFFLRDSKPRIWRRGSWGRNWDAFAVYGPNLCATSQFLKHTAVIVSFFNPLMFLLLPSCSPLGDQIYFCVRRLPHVSLFTACYGVYFARCMKAKLIEKILRKKREAARKNSSKNMSAVENVASRK